MKTNHVAVILAAVQFFRAGRGLYTVLATLAMTGAIVGGWKKRTP